jgi:hypothetical protein
MSDEIKKSMPKGVKKGGTRYPRQSLVEALPWAKKLVVKTHLGPQPQDVILAGVFGNSGPVGQIRLSTLKQYGLLKGDSKGYSATDLAKKVESSPEEELPILYRVATLNPPIFKALFDTFHGDEVTLARLKQRAAELKVHPEETENCVEIYVTSVVLANLAKRTGDKLVHVSAADALKKDPVATESVGENSHLEVHPDDSGDDHGREADRDQDSGSQAPRRAAFTVNLTLDSTLDADKLEQQLKLLKKYGAI